MRLKKWLIIPTALAIMISSVGCASKSTLAYKKISVDKSESADSFTKVEDGQPITVQNDKVKIDFDSSTTHFIVTDLVSGKQYASYYNGQDATSLPEENIGSEISLTYYEEAKTAQHMYSTLDSVKNGAYEVYYKDDAIRVSYELGATDASTFVPNIIAPERFKELTKKIDKKEGVGAGDYIAGFYKLAGPKNATDEEKEKYPSLKKDKAYVINEEVCAEDDKNSVREAMQNVGFDAESYKEDLEKNKLEDKSVAEKPGFTVPVEYRITEDGFTATVLSDLISEFSKTFRLQTVTLLEYFGCIGDSNGKFFVPDGCGALIDLSSEHVADYTGYIYGKDYSVAKDKAEALENGCAMPVYGIIQPDGGLFAMVESAGECAAIHTGFRDTNSNPNHIYVDFDVCHMDTTTDGTNPSMECYNIFATSRIKDSPSVRYVLMQADNCSYDNMAKYYRNLLISKGELKEVSESTIGIYVDYLGLAVEKSNFLGIPYNKNVVLSTAKEISESVDKLESKGVKNIALRLTGYSSDGLESKAANKFDLSKKVGKVSEIKNLSSQLEKSGGKMFLDADISFAYKNGNGFDRKTDSSHYLNRSLVKRGYYNKVTRNYKEETFTRYFVSAKKYLDYASGFIKSADKKLALDSLNVSYANAGKYLGGDYTPKGNVDRPTALKYLKQTLDYAKKNTKSIAFDGGNSYVLPYATDIYNVALNDSAYDCESEYVPFYQMVIHGSINYAGQALNLSYDSNEYLLRSLEFGAIPYYALMTRDNINFARTEYETMYFSTEDSDQIEGIAKVYNKVAPYYTAISGVAMTGHAKVAENTYCTTYANGCKMYVNYGSADANCDGVTVAANNFTFVQ